MFLSFRDVTKKSAFVGTCIVTSFVSANTGGGASGAALILQQTDLPYILSSRVVFAIVVEFPRFLLFSLCLHDDKSYHLLFLSIVSLAVTSSGLPRTGSVLPPGISRDHTRKMVRAESSLMFAAVGKL